MPYKNVIFDLGGVLLEWNPKQFLKELNLPVHFVEVFQSLLWAMHDGGLLTRDELVEKLPSQYDRAVFADCIKKIAPKLYLIAEMHEIFHEVRGNGYKVYILSNMPKEMHEELVQLHDFFQFPEGQVYSYKVKAIKPQPQIYEELLNRYQLKGPESIFIDDREENVVAAAKFGIDGIVCQTPSQVRQELMKRGLLK
jgi:putative hydrolase of the HAD superfamily